MFIWILVVFKNKDRFVVGLLAKSSEATSISPDVQFDRGAR